MTTTIANTILNQLGGNRFVAMTGAKNFVALENGIRFKIGRNKSKANTVKITVNGLDLYDIEFIKFTPFKSSVNHKTCTVTTRDEKTVTIAQNAENIKEKYLNNLIKIY